MKRLDDLDRPWLDCEGTMKDLVCMAKLHAEKVARYEIKAISKHIQSTKAKKKKRIILVLSQGNYLEGVPLNRTKVF